MPRQNVSLYSFNRGLVSPLALARIDLERLALSAETFDNWMPRSLGSMMLRPGTAYLGATASNNHAEFLPFIFSTDDVALVEITDLIMRVWVSDALVTRAAVTSAVINGTYDSDLASWADNDEAGGASAWVTGGYMGLTGNGTAAAIREQEVTTVEANTEHPLSIVIERGPVTLRVGSTTGDDDYISETTLGTGYHSLTLTPTGNFFIEFSSRLKRQVLVDSCDVESSGVMTVTAPWASADIDKIRPDQSGDILFVACEGYQQYKIERRSTTSWSIVKYEPEDGPFKIINAGPITITPSALTVSATLTASAALFKSTNVGGLYRITSTGQTVTATDIAAQDTWTNAIKITGVGSSRIFTIIRADRVDSTITLQRSLDSDTGPWEDVTTYTSNATITFDDSLDNQIAWYRIGVATGDYGTDAIDLTLTYALGSIDGVVRILTYSSATSVTAEIITDLGGTDATDDWNEGEWSDRRGFPTSVAFYEGRLAWAGHDGVWLSVTDSFSSFDDTTIGDSGPISRTIGSGPVDTINWLLAARRLLLGAEGAEFSCRSSSEDEVLTPTNFNIKSFSTQGSAHIGALKVDKKGIYIQRGGTRVLEAGFGADYEYESNDLTIFYPEAGSSKITHIAVQRQPDTRIHCVRTDGTVAILLYDRVHNILCWLTYSTDGLVEDVVVLPGADGVQEDAVYYVVNRTIGGTKRYLEKWSLESQCQGASLSRQCDSHIIYSGVGTSTITGLSHLEGESVNVWGNAKDLGTFTVSGGQITSLAESVTSACVGLTYTAQFKSAKLAYAAQGTALAQKKNVTSLGVLLYNSHYQGLEYGPNFTDMDKMPLVEDGVALADDTIHSTYDKEPFNFPGEWNSDSRLCLQAASPKPCTVLAAVIGIETHEKY